MLRFAGLLLSLAVGFGLAPIPTVVCEHGVSSSPTATCDFGYVVPGFISYATYYTPPPMQFETRALYQNNGVMEQTAAMKGYDLNGLDGIVALMSPATVGWTMWLIVAGEPPLHVRQVDVVEREHYYYHVVWENSALELSYALALRTGDVDYVNPNTGDRYRIMGVCLQEQIEDCAAPTVNYRDWFLSIVQYEG